MKNWQKSNWGYFRETVARWSISGAKRKNHTNYSASRKQKTRLLHGNFGIFDGKHLQSAVAIRFISQVDEKCYFHSGGGITIHSNVQDEYAELLEKVYLPIEGAD